LVGGLQLIGALWLAFFYGTWGLAAVLLSLPAYWRLVHVCREPIPLDCPPDYPQQAWPLWLTTHAFLFARQSGLWLTFGVMLQNGLGR
jgi:hypothetical protein